MSHNGIASITSTHKNFALYKFCKHQFGYARTIFFMACRASPDNKFSHPDFIPRSHKCVIHFYKVHVIQILKVEFIMITNMLKLCVLKDCC